MFFARCGRQLLVAGAAGISLNSVLAGVVDYSATQLGGSLWRYDYTINNTKPSIGFDELTVFFDPAAYAMLDAASAAAGWDPILVQPDAVIPSDGYYDVLKLLGLMAEGATAQGFSVSFMYFGAGVPSAQRFDLIDSRTFSVVYSGTTSPIARPSPVPEPASLSLTLAALFGMVGATHLLRKSIS